MPVTSVRKNQVFWDVMLCYWVCSSQCTFIFRVTAFHIITTQKNCIFSNTTVRITSHILPQMLCHYVMNTATYQKFLAMFRFTACTNKAFVLPVPHCAPTTEHHSYYKITPTLLPICSIATATNTTCKYCCTLHYMDVI
jgi:hypothetical protein